MRSDLEALSKTFPASPVCSLDTSFANGVKFLTGSKIRTPLTEKPPGFASLRLSTVRSTRAIILFRWMTARSPSPVMRISLLPSLNIGMPDDSILAWLTCLTASVKSSGLRTSTFPPRLDAHQSL